MKDSMSPGDAVPFDAIVAGTLCLMSCYAQHPIAAYAARVADNLARLAADAQLTLELRTVCSRLAERWSAIDKPGAAMAREVAVDTRSLH